MPRLKQEFLKFIGFFFNIIKILFVTKPDFSTILLETYDIGWKSLPIVVFIAIFIGTNLAIQGYDTFSKFGGENFLGIFVSLAGMREMAPIVAGAMVAAKSGADMAAKLAAMRIKEQIDALSVMSVNPIHFLIVPKFIAMVIVMPLLSLISSLFCLLSGFFVSVVQLGVEKGVFMENVYEYATLYDILIGSVKSIVFGIIICTMSTFFGYFARGGPLGVGRATNMAVVTSCVFSIIINYFLTVIFYD